MAIREMRLKDDEILRKKSKVVEKIDEKIITLLDDMYDTMTEYDGVGLAAVQVGVLKKIFIIEIDEQLYEFINPTIVSVEGEQINAEGCLSIPGESAYVERPEVVIVRATNRNGEEFELTATEFFATAVCHEYDHLDGILYIDRAIDESELEFVEDELE